MDSYRLIVGAVFAVAVFMLFDAWMRERAPVAPAPQAGQSAPAGQQPPVPTVSGGSAATAPALPGAAAGAVPGERITVRTDTLFVEIDTNGGYLRRVELLQHRAREQADHNFVLLNESGQHTYIAQSGLATPGLPNHNSRFSAQKTNYALDPGAGEIKVELTAQGDAGTLLKTFTFRRNSYLIDVALAVTNTRSEPLDAHAYFQLVRDQSAPDGSSKVMPTYNGIEIYTDAQKLTKVKFDDVADGTAKYPANSKDGWVAIVQHYFLAAWLPRGGAEREFFARRLDNGLIAAGVIVPMGSIAPAATQTFSVPLYVGPQEQDLLKGLSPGLELAVDYGWLRVVAVPLFWVLSKIHDFVGNWGVAIIILTVLIKLVFYPLSAASYKSMARMKVVAPKLQKLKERYGDDRQKLHQAMIELYKTEKINPLGGCLPILVQIPVFIALYWVLLLSVELRHAPFYFWIKDLSTPDPYYILPVLMGATMFIQTWLNPTPPDPMQARLMKIMPVAFSIFFFFFPAGLVLYWLVNNVLSIGQQWHITRTIERAKAAHGAA
ncbi:MAG: membrane protein insertase YidC [Burkholderiales bacterium]|nr:membrane protein insertase YidC [Burkholderiales bacterium]